MTLAAQDIEAPEIQLDPQQQLAVDYDDGPLAVLAGPGAGKTRVIVQRLVRLLTPVEDGGKGVAPESVVALAFTIKSANELRERLYGQLPLDIVERAFVGTSHSFGRNIVRRFGDMLGIDSNRRIADTAQCKRLLRELILEHDLLRSRDAQGRFAPIPDVLRFCERCRNDDVSYDRARQWIVERGKKLETNADELDEEALQAERAKLPLDADFVELYGHFEKERLSRGLLLLDDYITLPLRILREHENAAAIIHSDVRHIVVDEFQDWNPAQINLLGELAPARSISGKPADVCVVGDDDQSIYAFRGADNRAFARFEKLYDKPQVFELGTNYRSDPLVVHASQHVIEQSEYRFRPDKKLTASKPHDPTSSIEGITVATADDFGPAIAACLLEDHRKNGRAWKDCAVLVRSGSARDKILTACDLHNIPTTTRREPTPLDDASVQDFLAWCRLLADDSQVFALQRILLRPPIAAPALLVQSWHMQWKKAASNEESFLAWLLREHESDPYVQHLATLYKPLLAESAAHNASVMARSILHAVNLAHCEALSPRERARRIESLVQVVRCVDQLIPALPEPGDLAAFLAHYNDLSDHEQQFTLLDDSRVDGTDDQDDLDAVTVLTAHSAKGLEFDTVYIAGVQPQAKGSFPSTAKPDDTLVALDESLTGRVSGNHLDEERRLFYVACTRAQRRIVLLAKAKKARGKSTDFYYELKDDSGIEIAEHTGAQILERAGISPDTEQALRSQQATSRWIHEELAAALSRASSLVHRASMATLTTPELDALCKELGESPLRIHALSHLASTGSVPDHLLTHEHLGNELQVFTQRIEQEDHASRLLKPMNPPLKLSYTSISAYRQCPRCFYLQHVMGFREPPTPALAVGSIVHDAIAQYLRRCEAAQADGHTVPSPDVLLAIGDEYYDSNHLMRTDASQVFRGQIKALLSKYLNSFHADQAELLIIEGASPDNSSTVQPIPYEHNGIVHSIVAKPDRVERLSSGAFRIIDYKTGKARKDLQKPSRQDLQLAIYALSLQHHFDMPEPPAGVAEYWMLSDGLVGMLDIDKINWSKVHETITGAIEGMLNGDFAKSKNCRGACDILGDEPL